MPRRSTFLLLLLSLLAAATLPAAAVSDEEMQVLRMFYPESELVVTPTRTPKPISQVAENITVIGRKEIDAIHPHTLADILLLVPGVQIDMRGGPGTTASARIQGSGFRHVLLLVDGVRQNYLSNNFADIAAIPVEVIERIEIVKGPGSSAWGSALGGVINVITREPPDERGAEGELQGVIGERKTNALRGYAAGAGDTLAGVAAASYLHSDGLTPHTAVEGDQGYARLRWQPTERTTLRLTAMGSDNQQGSGFYPPQNLVFDDESSSLQLTALLNQSVTDSFDLEVALRSAKRNLDQRQTLLSGGEFLSQEENRVQGGSLKGTWRLGPHQLLLGSDLERGEIDSDYVGPGQRVVEQYAFFANDSMLFGPLSVTPGLRFDHTSVSGDFVSPSLGLTWGIGEQSVLRLAVARGFTSPPLSALYGDGLSALANPALKAERVWSYQGGVETSLVPYLWLKGTLFRHDIADVLDREAVTPATFRIVNRGKEQRQGVEVELRTVPVFDTSVSAGYTFIDAEDRQSGERIANEPRTTVDAGLHYDRTGLGRATLMGHYIWWNIDPVARGHYSSMLWDLHLSAPLSFGLSLDLEPFLSIRNLFNGAQYAAEPFRNPGRWVEGGATLRF